MATTAAEVRGHSGYGYSPTSRGHFGYWYLEETAIVTIKKKKAPAKTVSSGGGQAYSTTYTEPLCYEQPVFELTETALEQLASRITAFAQSPELQTWTSSVLSTAGRNGEDLSTEPALARTLLKEVQKATFPLADRTAKALYLAAGLVAIGLPTALVAHGEITLTRALAYVYADTSWLYADPNWDAELGQNAPFLREKVIRIPDLAKPAVEEVRQYKEQIKQQQEQLRQMAVQLETYRGMLTELTTQLATDLSAPAQIQTQQLVVHVERDRNREWLYKAIAVGACTLLVVALWQLHKASKQLDEEE